MRFVLLCLLCLGCVSGAPTTYNQGAFRPAPPVFVPSQDAPHTIGQPGHLKPQRQIEPNPKHKRHLPPTREPGIWAGDEPKASGDPVKPTLEIAGVPLPVPEPQWSVNALEDYAPPLCHGLITHNAFSPGHALRGDAFTPEQKACLIAAWYKHCLSWAAEAIVDKRSKGIATVMSPFWKRYVDPASRFEKEKCTPEILNSKDRHGRDSLQRFALFRTDYWNDVYKSYQRTHP